MEFKKLLTLALCICTIGAYAQDVIVKHDGSTILSKVIKVGTTEVEYKKYSNPDGPTYSILKSDILAINYENGDKDTFTDDKSQPSNIIGKTEPAQVRKPTTAEFVESVKAKGHNKCFAAKTPDGHILNYAVLSEEERTVTVIKGEYHETKYVIPEFVNAGGITYTVTEIDEGGFEKESTITEIQFPQTLKKIRDSAFFFCPLTSIILPEGLEEIGAWAFCMTGAKTRWKVSVINEIYLPSSVKTIGSYCFFHCGKQRSYRGFCQAYFSNMPQYINEATCKDYGIDEEAVKAYKASK